MSSDLYNKNIYINVVLRSVLGVLSTAGNGLVIFIILRNKNAVRDGFNVLLLQLALGDLFIGFGNVVRVVESLLNHFKLLTVTPINCFLVELPLLIGINLSQLIMFLIAVDRFICITQLHGMTLINNKTFIWTRASLCISFALLVSFAALIGLDTTVPIGVRACYVTMGWSRSYLNYFSGLTTFFSITIVVAYALTFLSYWCYQKRATHSIIHRERRIAQTLMLIVLAYLVFWCLPRFVTFVYKWIGVENGFSQSVTGSIGYLNALNSLVNVAIYGCKHRQIRDGMLAVLGLAASKYVAGNKIFTTVSSTMNHHR